MYIYILTHIESGKKYVGKSVFYPIGRNRRITAHFNLQSKSTPLIHNAIKKYGKNAFSYEILYYPYCSHNSLKSIESSFMFSLKSLSPNGYNLKSQVDGVERHSEYTKTKMSKSHMGNQRRVGKTHSIKVREKMSLDRKGVILTPEHIENISKGQRKLVENGTHHLLNKRYSRMGVYARRIKNKNRRRELYQIYAALLYSKSVFQMNAQKKNCDIPDTSKATQLTLF